jgi:hypothetical protein
MAHSIFARSNGRENKKGRKLKKGEAKKAYTDGRTD